MCSRSQPFIISNRNRASLCSWLQWIWATWHRLRRRRTKSPKKSRLKQRKTVIRRIIRHRQWISGSFKRQFSFSKQRTNSETNNQTGWHRFHSSWWKPFTCYIKISTSRVTFTIKMFVFMGLVWLWLTWPCKIKKLLQYSYTNSSKIPIKWKFINCLYKCECEAYSLYRCK